jgi:ATP-dependent DNA helicase RecG
MTSIPAAPVDPLLMPVQYAKGIGPRKSAALAKVGVQTVHDLLFYIPRRHLDRTKVLTIAQLRQQVKPGMEYPEDVTVVGEVRSFRVAGVGRRARFVLVLADQTGSLQCVWFGGVNYWKNAFEIGETLAVSGEPSYFGGVLQIVHPALDRISGRVLKSDTEEEEQQDTDSIAVDWGKTLHTGGLVPLYPSGKELEQVGLDSAGFRRVIYGAVQRFAGLLRDTLPEEVVSKHGLIPLSEAVRNVHFPRGATELDRSMHRLKYEELFYFQMKLALKRHWFKETTAGIAFNTKSGLARRLVDSLPFRLTGAQIRVIKEIAADMERGNPMNRLLQGDVGSGKTIVALIAMLIAIDNGYQAAFMAPTELLAEQHSKTIGALIAGLPVNMRLLVGAQRSRLRRDILEDVRQGTANIVVGTHALFEKQVEFARLGLVVIDEQHRFGVLQRASLRRKGENPDVLVMTATPIPRTLSLTVYGDLDVSIIDELPLHRKPIKTILKYEEEKESVYAFVRDQISAGRQAYFVYPLIEESEKVDLKAAVHHYEQLQSEMFPELKLGLLHGRMPGEEKDAVMQRFRDRELDILVATTVIEVGIDVANATVMVIEDAEQFGLSQLHQLRGRVGRGAEQSYCILLAKKWLAKGAVRYAKQKATGQPADEERVQAQKRLATMVSTTDGFRIAEVDLELRGPGDFFGTRQSGIPEFRVANILTDTVVLASARKDAFSIVSRDPSLALPQHRLVRDYVRAHFREAVALLQTG